MKLSEDPERPRPTAGIQYSLLALGKPWREDSLHKREPKIGQTRQYWVKSIQDPTSSGSSTLVSLSYSSGTRIKGLNKDLPFSFGFNGQIELPSNEMQICRVNIPHHNPLWIMEGKDNNSNSNSNESPPSVRTQGSSSKDTIDIEPPAFYPRQESSSSGSSVDLWVIPGRPVPLIDPVAAEAERSRRELVRAHRLGLSAYDSGQEEEPDSNPEGADREIARVGINPLEIVEIVARQAQEDEEGQDDHEKGT